MARNNDTRLEMEKSNNNLTLNDVQFEVERTSSHPNNLDYQTEIVIKTILEVVVQHEDSAYNLVRD